MCRSILLAVLFLAACASAPRTSALDEMPPRRPMGSDRFGTKQDLSTQPSRLAGMVGARELSDTDVWDPVDEELVAGVQYSKVGQSGFGVELGVLGSTGFRSQVGSNVDITAAVLELYGGLRKELDWGRWRPSIGGGAALLAAAIDNDAGGGVADDQDTTSGLYFHGGLMYDLDSNAFLGVVYRAMTATELDLGTVRADVDYQQITLMIGLRF